MARREVDHAGEPPRSPSPGSYELWSTKGEPVVPDPTPAEAPAAIGYFAEGGEPLVLAAAMIGARRA